MTEHYQVVKHQSSVRVRTPSTFKTVESIGYGLSGTLTGDLSTLATINGHLSFAMESMSLGNKVQDWSLMRQLEVKKWPIATFQFDAITVRQKSPWKIAAHGTLDYRDRRTPLDVNALVKVTDSDVDALARFEIDLRQIGVTPPQFLFLKAANIVEVVVQLYALRTE